MTPGQLLKNKNKKTVTDVEAADDNASYNAMDTNTQAPNYATFLGMENKNSLRQLIDNQEYTVTKCDIIQEGFDHEAGVEICMAYLNDLYQHPGCPRYNSDRTTLCTCLKTLPIENNDMLVAAQFMLDFRGMQLYTKKAL